MDIKIALEQFSALSQETRLNAFRLLVTAGPSGLPAGKLSSSLGIPHNTLSFHLSHLTNANLIHSEKQGRSIIYSANFTAMRNLIGFLVKNCCRADMAQVKPGKKTGSTIIQLKTCC